MGWKYIDGFKDRYAISDTGVIYDTLRQKTLKPDEKGFVNLRNVNNILAQFLGKAEEHRYSVKTLVRTYFK